MEVGLVALQAEQLSQRVPPPPRSPASVSSSSVRSATMAASSWARSCFSVLPGGSRQGKVDSFSVVLSRSSALSRAARIISSATREIGAVCFGVVVGWITYRTLRRQGETVALSNIATVIGAVGGATVTGLFSSKELFGLYSIGLAAGFFLYLLLGSFVFKSTTWLGNGD
jgi:uncharacterized membrane protein YeaQ/YmgE (transglycosylase-associated protein family)